jgi:NADH-quinone oxidoreductase subunit G
MVKIIVDEREYEVKEGQNMLQAVLSVGLDLPYFCWHPAMGSVGACRQCAVRLFRDANDTGGRLAMACMTPANEGTRISINDAEAHDFRESVIEWLMTNHPHDCPVCDEGGECHLQDMTLMTGHDYRRYRGKKRTFRNQYLGPFVNHEMNRCIQCYRCVRFYRDVADGRDFDVFGIRSLAYYGRQFDGVLESEFSGNLVEICPTGVFTDKTFKEHYTRKWDLQTAPSICVNCGVGCNTIPGERYGTLRRIRNRYNGEVNGYFLCDRGRYGYEFVNSERRLLRACVLEEGSQDTSPVSHEEALEKAKKLLGRAKRVVGIGSPRASLEANFALKTLVGAEDFYAGVSDGEWRLLQLAVDIMQNSGVRSPSLLDVARSDAAFVLGEDVTQTAPMMGLALRQSSRQAPLKQAAKMSIPSWDAAGFQNVSQGARGPLFVASCCTTRLDDIATHTYNSSLDDVARLGFAVAHAIDAASPPMPVLPDGVRDLVKRIAEALMAADDPLIVTGCGAGSEAVMQAAANVARALHQKGRPVKLSLAVPECNSLGLALLGAESLQAAFDSVTTEDAIVILENDLYRRTGSDSVDAFLKKARSVIVIDHIESDATAKASVVLPATTFAECDGTLVNYEGRAQRFYSVITPRGEARESWRWLRDLESGKRAGMSGWTDLDAVDRAVAAAVPVFEQVSEVSPPAGFRIAGAPIARQPHRYSGRTSMFANLSVNELPPPADVDSPFVYSMEGFQGDPPSPLVSHYWAPGWNSVQSLNKFQEEIAGPLRGGDPGRRLIEPVEGAEGDYFKQVPHPRTVPGQQLFAAAHHIFGSEELSVMSPSIAGLVPEPYVGLSPADAHGMSIASGEVVEITIAGRSERLPVKVIDTLCAGMAVLPVGLPGLEPFDLPALGELKAPSAEEGPGQ